MVWSISKKKVPFPFVGQKPEGIFFPDIYSENVVKLLKISHKTVDISLSLGPPVIFNSQSCPYWVPRNASITVQLLLPRTHSWVSGPESLLRSARTPCFHLPHSTLAVSSLPCSHLSRRVIDFSVCSAFYL